MVYTVKIIYGSVMANMTKIVGNYNNKYDALYMADKIRHYNHIASHVLVTVGLTECDENGYKHEMILRDYWQH